MQAGIFGMLRAAADGFMHDREAYAGKLKYDHRPLTYIANQKIQ